MDRINLEKLSISGFRAFLKEQNFLLYQNGSPRSLAIFAPNAKGKSSLIDSIEYFFSKDGTLKRIGLRRSGTQAGREALEHYKSKEKNIPSTVSILFNQTGDTFGDTRDITSIDQRRPQSAQKLLDSIKVEFIIRGYELRRFVEDQTPQERYQEASGWFGLSSLTSIQNNIRDLRLNINSEISADRAKFEKIRDLKRLTNNSISEWNEKEIIHWLNATIIEPLKVDVTIESLDKKSKTYEILKNEKEEEEKKIGISILKQLCDKIKLLHEEVKLSDGSIKSEFGLLVSIERYIAKANEAYIKKQEEQSRSEKAIFKDVWEKAKKVFEDNTLIFEKCPICNTPFGKTKLVNREQITSHIKAEISALESYSKAEKELSEASKKVGFEITNIKQSFSNLITALSLSSIEIKLEDWDSYRESLDSWKVNQPAPDALKVKNFLGAYLDSFQAKIGEIEKRQGEHTFFNAVSKIDELIDLKIKLKEIENINFELKKLHDLLLEYEKFLVERIREFIQYLIDTLKDDVNTLYRSVHPVEESAPSIHLELPKETRQTYLNLLVDFAPNRQGVVPSGYLTDSQLHTLALSLRLAAIRLFNQNAPIIILDDVVTSYDADHRKAIAAMFERYFKDYQMIIVTHDERFFLYLQEHLPRSNWIFKRILNLEEDFGPLFHDQKIPDFLIEEKLSKNESAANEMRQAEEEWLLQVCRDFGVDIRIRDVHHPYDFDRSELATALFKFLKSINIEVPKINGIANSFIVTLQSGLVENFGSHFSDNPYAYSSPGDQLKRWKEFKEFRDLFVCSRCGCKRFKRPRIGVEKPLCNRCETPFDFSIHIPNEGGRGAGSSADDL
jgi:hypothetical protein